MKKIPIIQYLPLTRPKASRRLLNKLESSNVASILDLEDSAQNIFDFEATCILKEEARNGLLLISSTFESPYKSPIYIRVNSIDTQFFEEDIKTVLQSCENGIPITGIFLPMIRNYSQIVEVNTLLSVSKRPLEIVPMIETQAGVDNLPELLDNDKDNNLFSKVHYGHFDYCLDAQIWPFPDPFHKSFWEIVKPIIKLLVSHNKTYVHTPFPFPQDENLFWGAAYHLSTLDSSLEAWVCTVNAGLSLLPQPQNIPKLKLIGLDLSHKQKIVEAEKICNNFLAGRSIKRSFGVKENRFIPPHQFLAAKKFLDNNKN